MIQNMEQTLMVQVAKRSASVLRKRKSRNRMDTSGVQTTPPTSASSKTGIPPDNPLSNNIHNNGNGVQNEEINNTTTVQIQQQQHQQSAGIIKNESDVDVVFYTDEPRSGKTLYFCIYKL